MRVTCASLVTSGRAEKVARAVWPTATLEMSTSLTCTVTVIWERSAICMRVPEAPVPMPPVAAPRAAPTCAFMTTTVPAEGAVTVRLAARATASS